jgi:hypothetical protein
MDEAGYVLANAAWRELTRRLGDRADLVVRVHGDAMLVYPEPSEADLAAVAALLEERAGGHN